MRRKRRQLSTKMNRCLRITILLAGLMLCHLPAAMAGGDGGKTGGLPVPFHRRGKTWANLADRTYRSAAGLPQGITVAPDGRVYVSMDGTGVNVGAPAR